MSESKVLRTATGNEGQLDYSFEAYLQYDDGTDNCYELVEGRLEQMNPPTVRHILIAKFLERRFDEAIDRLGLPWLCLREAGVRTGWKKSRIPDLCVVLQDDAMALTNESAVLQVPPMLVVEIVSEESVRRDYRYKRSEYAALGIPEYWIVDPLQNRVTVLLWEEGFYEESVFSVGEEIESRSFPDFKVSIEAILQS
ncbi:MAG: Uma2 family endonuclease [Cyanobacteria bacterium SID2]|nr:Uma2 family endonuclease [Cyanobacteria bacterium SID2]